MAMRYGGGVFMLLLSLSAFYIVYHFISSKYTLDFSIPQLFSEDTNLGSAFIIAKRYKSQMFTSQSPDSIPAYVPRPTMEPTRSVLRQPTFKPSLSPSTSPSLPPSTSSSTSTSPYSS
eukprot:gene44727-59708_t